MFDAKSRSQFINSWVYTSSETKMEFRAQATISLKDLVIINKYRQMHAQKARNMCPLVLRGGKDSMAGLQKPGEKGSGRRWD